MLILGVDPGVHGALALVDTERRVVLDCIDMPTVPLNSSYNVDGTVLGDWLDALVDRGTIWQLAIVEAVHADAKWSKARCVTLGRLAGGAAAILSMHPQPVLHAAPVAWKRRAGLLKKDKAASMAVAANTLRWPAGMLRLASHHGRAEAALIAVHGRAPERPAPAPRRSKKVERAMAENVPPGELFKVLG